MRPNELEYFLSITSVIATRSTCFRAQHGAIIVRDGQVLSTGYNGAAKGISHCTDTGICVRASQNIKPGTCYELCVAVHAEANAIAQAAKHGICIDGATIYITGQPCVMCQRLIANSGIVQVTYRHSDRYAHDVATLQASGLVVLIVGKEDG